MLRWVHAPSARAAAAALEDLWRLAGWISPARTGPARALRQARALGRARAPGRAGAAWAGVVS
ncbi:hypothetical protein FMEAI12_2590019 [Parafrankia sp. Ea1.12]|nr:hypothetical protein FMEAI12_2590019 [Parafrankia sp. Ea1.12]